MSPFPSGTRENKAYYLPLLIIISIVSHFPFVLNGFGEIDAAKIGVSVIDILNHGSDAAFSNFYFTDVIPLYILYLKWFMKLLNYNYSYLPALMNYTNAVFGTLIIIPAFLLIRQIFRNPTIAFCSVFALIFAPAFFQSTIMGFPHLIAFFFLLLSLCCYLSGLDTDRVGTVSLLMLLSCLFLTTAFLFKSDSVLVAGIYVGLLFVREKRNRWKTASPFLIIVISGILFLLLRDLIIGPTSGTTMSKDGMSKWYNYSIVIPSAIEHLLTQGKPIAYAAGIATFFLGGTALIYYLIKKRADLLIFVISWAAVPTIFWFFLIGNNARHNMLSVLPVLVMIIFLFHEKAPRFIIVLTAMLILGNFFAVPASPSILRPSGNLFKSHALLADRISRFQSGAKEIAGIPEDKIAVLGFFHNPHVIFQILSSAPSYRAFKIGREDYKIQTGDKEYVFIYFVLIDPADMKKETDKVLNEYSLHKHVFTSVTYDLKPLRDMGLKTRSFDIIERTAL
ncbi:MAG: hypothetical protein C4526_02305 [Nitrospiraceae bacterium]|nr:MAG: hypothetical protein C4526_02305 [Nitrospiraceae bacterium]